MWIPTTEAEIVAALEKGGLHETASFEAKRQMPETKKNSDIATDVAAMSTDGGVIIYGLDEDENHFVTKRTPIPLAGSRERIDAIVQASVTEVPNYSIRSIESKEEPGQGYIVVVVPPSVRAPHMVIVKGEYRFYGRGDTNNRPLNQGEVARLYERRAQAQVGFANMLREEIGKAPVPPSPDRGYLHVVVVPNIPNASLLTTIDGDKDIIDFYSNLATTTNKLQFLDRNESNFSNLRHTMREIDGYQFSDRSQLGNEVPSMVLKIDFSGVIHLFSGSAARKMTHSDGKEHVIVEANEIAVLTLRLLYLSALVYQKAGYFGSLTIGLALTNINRGKVTFPAGQKMHESRYKFQGNEYLNTTQAGALSLIETYPEVVDRLLESLFAALYQRPHIPFRTIVDPHA